GGGGGQGGGGKAGGGEGRRPGGRRIGPGRRLGPHVDRRRTDRGSPAPSWRARRGRGTPRPSPVLRRALRGGTGGRLGSASGRRARCPAGLPRRARPARRRR